MRYKKFMILAIFLVSLLAVSAVSAADNATSDIVSTEETTDEIVCIDENQVILREDNNVGTFTELANEIADAGSQLNLTKNYIYSNDSNYNDGITMDKSIVINGNGYTIDGNNQARIFNILASNVTLNNINFVNSFSEAGGAIYWEGANGILFNCSFVNSSSYSEGFLSSSSGGSVYWEGANGILFNCSFVNSSSYAYDGSSGDGGSVYWEGANGILSNCNFVNSSSYSEGFLSSSSGGSVYWEGANGILFNCSFVNSSSYVYDGSSGDGGSVYWEGANGILSNCSFVNSSSYSEGSLSSANGGSVYWEGANGILSNCNFINTTSSNCGGSVYWSNKANYGVLFNCSFMNSSAYDGGSVDWHGNNGALFNCSFVNSSSNHFGGAVDWNSKNGTLFDCNFVNSLSEVGGAISWLGNIGILSNCSFVKSTATNSGGAIYWEGIDGILSNCNFTNSCTSVDGSGGVISWWGTNGNVSNCNFVNSTAIYSAGVIYWMANDGVVYNCNFINSTASKSNSGAIDWSGTNGVVFNCSFINSISKWNGGAVCWGQVSDYGVLANCSFVNSSSSRGGAVYWDGDNGVLANCSFVKSSADDGNAVYWSGENGIINKSYFSPNFNSIFFYNYKNLKIIKIYSSSLSCENISLKCGDNMNLSAYLNTYGQVIFNMYNEYNTKSYIVNTTNEGIATLTNELNKLSNGLWNVTVTFEGNDNYNQCNTTATITVLQANSLLTIGDINTTWDQETIFTANVISNNKTINEGLVSFYIDDEFIGNASVIGGVASLTHEAPGDAGNHILTAIYTGNNYLTSNNTAKLFVDTGDIPVEDYDSVATFKSLAKLIENTPEGGILNLTKDYYYVSGSTEGIYINKAITIDGQGHILNGNQLSRIVYVNANDVILKNINFVNGSAGYGGAVYWQGNNGNILGCSFVNNSDNSKYYGAGAVYWRGDNGVISGCSFVNNSDNSKYYGTGAVAWWGYHGVISGCSFVNNSASYYGGAVSWWGGNATISGCSFVNNSASYGGAVYLVCNNNFHYGVISGCSFVNNSASYGGAVEWDCDEGVISGCSFVNNSASYGGAVAWSRGEGVISGCSFVNNSASYGGAIYWMGDHGIINNSYFSPHSNTIYKNSNLEIIKIYSSSLSCDDISGEYHNVNLSAYLNTCGQVIFNIYDEYNYKTFIVDTTNEGIATLSDELNDLTVGSWNVTVIFEGDDNYYPCNTTATITILPVSSSLTIEDANTTVGHEITLVANVNSNLTVNEGVVTFFDGKTEIGESSVSNGVATLSYAPSTDGEHIITAIFNSDNYLSSNDTAKLLVDSATVEVLADTGTVGFESNFVANVKGLYSTINEGNVYFYINDEYIGKDKVVDGVATLTYTPLIAGEYTVRVVYSDSVNFHDAENTTYYAVDKADSQTIINDINGTVGHDLTLTANVISSNKLTINEGTVSFFDDETNIGEVDVIGGVATLEYTPTTAGEHTITAVFNSDNYQSSNSSALLTVAKADVDLIIDYIADVYFTEPSRFTVNVNSNSNAVNEGEVKFYVNDVLVGSSDVYNGIVNFDYVADSADYFILKVVYDETDNYFSSDATSVFNVNKMPTTLSGETVFFDEDEYKTYTTELRDANNNGVANKVTKVEVVKYDGGSRTFTGVSDYDGVTTYDINALAGGMWIVRGIYSENENYIGSTFTNMFIVIRMNTTTTIEEIASPRVNHTYKLKANIHDENGKLVKEGIVQFYLDGVDIGYIDLSENQGHQNALRSGLLGAGEDDEPYLEYTPTQAGNFTLSAVYEGTTVYKSSSSETDFIVKEFWKNTTELVTSDVTTSYKGDSELIVTLMDDDAGKVISGADLAVNLNNVAYTLKTNSKGKASLSIPSNLSPKTYTATISYDGNEAYESSTTTAKIVVNKADTIISAPDVTVAYKDAKGKLVATITNQYGKPLGVNVNVTLNGKTTTVKADSKGQITIPTNTLYPGTYTATITYAGNNNYNPTTTTANVIVTKADTIISAKDTTVTYKNPTGQLVATLKNAYGNALSVNVNVNLNGQNYTIKANSKGQINIPTEDLPIGTHVASISYNGNNNYNPSSATANIIVGKANTIISAENITVAYKDPAEQTIATLTDSYGNAIIDTVTVKLNGKAYTVKADSEGQISISTADLYPGNYVASISYNGNDNYNPSSATANIAVTKADTVIAAPDVTVAYKDTDGKLVATITNQYGKPLSVNLNVDLNGKTTTVKADSQGQISIPTDTLYPGTYTATITYPGNGNYKPTNTTANVVVTKANTIISAKDTTVTYKDTDGKLVATITNQYGKPLSVNLNVKLNGKTTTVKADSQGQISIPTDTLYPGTYKATITYPGNGNYKSTTKTVNVVVNKADTSISVAYTDENVVATLTSQYGKPLSVNLNVNINGETYTIKADSKGQISIPAKDLAPGTYTATISYKGNGNYNPSNATAEVVIKIGTEISASDITVVYKDSGELVATITDADGNALSGVDLNINFNKKTYTLTSDSNGQISILINEVISPKTYVATISYAGDDTYAASSTTANVVVAKADTTINAPDVTVKQGDANGKLVARITNQYGSSIGVNLNININGETYTLRTDIHGKVSWSTENLAKGTYTATVTYAGNGNYNPTNTTATITVK